MPLNDAKVKAAKPRDTAYKLTDGGQLYLHVTTAGGKHWRMNYTFGTNLAGKPAQKTLTIGRYPIVSLGEAREARDAAKKILLAGRDPAVEKKLASTVRAAAAVATFQSIGEKWFELKSGWSLAKLDAWKEQNGSARVRDAAAWSDPTVAGWSAVHSDDVLKTLRNDAFPALGSLPIADIKRPLVLELLREVEGRGAIETAHRLRQRLSAVFNYAIAAGLATDDPAPRALTQIMRSKPKEQKQPSIIDGIDNQEGRIEAVRTMLAKCEAERTRAGTKFALRLLALTAVRPGEVAGARWTEFEDLGGQQPLWRIPAARMKGTLDRKSEAGGDHLVPLSPQAVEILEALHPLSGRYDLLFPSERHVHRPISENTLRALLIRAGYYQRHVPHGFRAAFSTIMNERAKLAGRGDDRPIIDLMLAHVPKDRVEGAYNRSAYLDRRRELACEYADLIIVGLPAPEEHIGKPIRYAASGPGRQ